MALTLVQEEYEALVALAREGASARDLGPSGSAVLSLESFLATIEQRNGIVRDACWVQWQEAEQPLPANTRFPEVWPPELRVYIEYVGRLVARADVDDMLTSRASKPVSVLVTRDPQGIVGWTELDAYFK